MAESTWMSSEKGWGVLRGLYGFKGWYMWRPEGQIKSHFLGSELIPQLLVSPSDGTWREEMVALERHDLIG